MLGYSPSQLSDPVLLRKLSEVAARDRALTAELLALIAEVEKRRLYREKSFESMFEYCTRELRMSRDMAYKRIRAARAARRFPSIPAAVVDGRLNVSALVQLSPYLKLPVAGALLVEAEGKSRRQIESLIARHFPQPDAPTLVQAIPPVVAAVPAPASAPQVATPSPAPAEPALAFASANVVASSGELAPGLVAPSVPTVQPQSMVPNSQWGRVTELSPGHFRYQFMLRQEAHERLEYAKALLGHTVPSGDIAQVIERALDALIQQLEKSKLGRRSRTQPSARRRSRRKRFEASERYVPDQVKSAVWERDGGQCTFRSEQGRRCEAKARLEFDHIQPIGRGGLSTVENIRLHCRPHNQLAAERTYGEAFMQGKRERASRNDAGGTPTAWP